MAFSFSESPSYLFTSESVTDGHPDKLCDQISDALLDEFLRIDPMARVACEVCITTGLVVVMGEITLAQGYVDIPAVVRQTLKEAGYVDSSYGFDYQSCGIVVSIHEQSRDISSGVSKSLEVRGGAVTDHEVESLGAGDQGMMVGYACDETAELMPLPIALAHRLCQRMAEARKQGHIPYLRPDGKSQVTVEYEHGAPKRVHTVVLSSQHSPDASQPDIERDLVEHVAKEVIPEELLDGDTRYVVNPSGAVRHRRSGGRHGPHGPEDPGGHLRRVRPPRRGRLLGQGPDQGGPIGGLRRQVRRQESRGGGAGVPPGAPGLLRHRHGEPHLDLSGDLRDQQGPGRPHRASDGQALRP